jgi:hypothetical protein
MRGHAGEEMKNYFCTLRDSPHPPLHSMGREVVTIISAGYRHPSSNPSLDHGQVYLVSNASSAASRSLPEVFLPCYFFDSILTMPVIFSFSSTNSPQPPAG